MASPDGGVLADGVDAAALLLTLRDAEGRGLSGVDVRFTAPVGVVVDPPGGVTDAAGQATAQVTAVRAGVLEVVALAGETPVASVGVGFVPGPASALVLDWAPGALTAGTPIAPAPEVRVVDSRGNPTGDGAAVRLVLEGAEGGLAGPAETDTWEGRAIFEGLAVTVAAQGLRLRAESTGLSPATSAPFDVGPGPAARLAFTGAPTTVVAGAVLDPPAVLQLQDAWGNPVPGASRAITVSLAQNPTDDKLGGDTLHATTGGSAAFDDLVLHFAAEGVTLLATAESIEAAESGPITVKAGAALGLTFLTPPVSFQAGEPMPAVRVAAVDGFGNVDTGFGDLVALATGLGPIGAQLAGDVAVDAEAGIATFEGLTLTQARPVYTIKGLAQGLTNVTSAPFTVFPGAPAALQLLSSPTFGCVGLPLSPPLRVGLEDQYGNPTLSGGTEVALSLEPPTTGALGGVTSAVSAHGVATLPAVVVDTELSGARLVASAAGIAGAETDPFDVTSCVSVEGTLTYDSVPGSNKGLKYDETVVLPIRGVEVHAVAAGVEGQPILAETVSGADGAYLLAFPEPQPAFVRVYARTMDPPIRIQDNTSSDAVYTLESEAVEPLAEGLALDLHAASGWTGEEYGEARAAAPFSILDTALRAAEAVLAVRDPLLPLCKLNWSVENRPEPGNPSQGQITSTHFSPYENEIFLTGKADVSTDEYDQHSVVHEWTHWLESNMGRSDSFGGVHWIGARVDARLAFGEGLADAMSAIVLYPKSVYAMSFGKGQSEGWGFNLEKNGKKADPHPGWFSEASVGGIVYDVFDPDDEAWDTVTLGLGPIYDVLVGPQVSTSALTTIFSFVAALKAAAPEHAEAIDALCGKLAFGPVLDEWGTGELNFAEWPENLPVYRETAVDAPPLVLHLAGKVPPEFVFSNRFVRFPGVGAGVTVTATAVPDVDLFVYRQGELLAHTASNQSNTLSLQTDPGAIYVVVVRGKQANMDTYEVALEVTSP